VISGESASFLWLCTSAIALAAILIPLALSDWRFLRLPDILTSTLFVSGFLFVWAQHSLTYLDAVVGAAAGSGAFYFIRIVYFRLRRVEGLGLGDVKLMAGLGAWLGAAWLPPVVLIAAMLGLAVVALQAVMAKREISTSVPLPFGSYLCLSGFVVWCFKNFYTI